MTEERKERRKKESRDGSKKGETEERKERRKKERRDRRKKGETEERKERISFFKLLNNDDIKCKKVL